MNRSRLVLLLVAALGVIAGILLLRHESPRAPMAGTTTREERADVPPPVPAPPEEPAQREAVPAPVAPAPALIRTSGQRVPTKADAPPAGRAPAALPLPPDFLEKIVDAAGQTATFALPDGRQASGRVELLRRDDRGILLVQGKLTQPQPGMFFFQRQTVEGVAGAMVGNVRFHKGDVAFRVDPIGPGGAPMLVERKLSQVVCMLLEPPDPVRAPTELPQNAPQTHPTDIPIPDYQNGVIPLQSLPGATGVIYLDFDGEPGPFSGWGSFDAAPSGASNTQIKEVWQRVAEDFQPFNLNVTTDRKVFDNAQEGRRQHVLLTPTTTAAPGAGGVAFIGSFNNSGDTVCWAFYATGKNGAEVTSHEIGHTLGLSHDGRSTPNEEYYGGHGSGSVGWAPIMGVGYYQPITEWSKGEYTSADNTEDDLAVIINNNNSVDNRADDHGPSFASASYLEILANNTVSNEGIIETRSDVDAFRFASTGGAATFTVNAVNTGANIDLLAEIYDEANVLVSSNNPDTQINATVAGALPAGSYTLRISGVGRGVVTDDGYSDYASIGAYLITGSVVGGVKPSRFTINEHSVNGTAVGTVQPLNDHGATPLAFAIASGNTGGTFAIDAATGAITVANLAGLNYETLSTRWDDPATYQLFVTITDSADPLLNETIRVVVTVADINEAPTITAGGTITMFERTRAGTPLTTLTSNDPDRFEFPTFSIVSGNIGNVFAIDATSGQITIVGNTNAVTRPSYSLSVRATDHETPPLTATTTVTVNVLALPAGYIPGAVVRTYYENITGSAVSALTSNPRFPLSPDSEETLTAFDGGPHGDNFGSTIRGFIIPPATGAYTFWISGSDSTELRISPTASPAAATVRASATSATARYEWTKFPSQQSTPITLQAGQPVYVEARHKEATGGDHVAVAWQGPGISQRVIPGLYVAPFVQDLRLSSPLTDRVNVPNGVGLILEATNNGKTGTTIAWSKVSGPGTVTFGTPATLNTTANFSSPGAYVVRCTEVDAGISSAVDVDVNVGSTVYQLSGAGVGEQTVSSSHTLASGVYNISASGNGIPSGGATDDFYFIHIGTSGNVTVTARVVSVADVDGSNSRAGVMIRESLLPNSREAFCGVTSQAGGRFIYRVAAGNSASSSATVAQPYWVRLIRTGNSFVAQTAPDSAGTPGAFAALGSAQTLSMSTNSLVGLAATSGSTSTAGAIVIDNVTITPTPANLGPNVNAGPNATVFLPASAALNGTVTDDAKPTPPGTFTTNWQRIGGPGTATFGNANAIDTTAAFNTSGLQILRLTANDGQMKTFDEVTLNVQLAPIEQWRQQRFGVDAENPLIAGNLADPDDDGLENGLEYSVNSDPLAAGVSPIASDLETIGPDQFLRLTVPRNPAATDVTLSIEVTGDLTTPASWSSNGTTVEENTTTLLRTRDNTPVTSAVQRSIRLKVTMP